MKKLLWVLSVSFLLMPCPPELKAQEVSVDLFYNNLDGGSWVEVSNYGYCWQPDLAVSNSSWRPYADGYWAYTDLGWTWISYEEFGWATYHYGRWLRLADLGWIWVPGYHWAPAWVSWRYGGNYVGWAPLPPETEVIYESRPLTGHLDVEFDIGPAYYNFIDVRYIGEPVLRSRLIPYEQNITYVTQTVNVTNVTYKNKTVYSYGPDINVLNQYSSRPIQKLKLERQTNVDAATAAKSGGLTKVQGNSLIVAAPPEIKKASATPPPPKLKAKVEQPKIEKGWSMVGDENSKQQLKEKLEAEDPTKIPPPTLGASPAANANGSASPGTSGAGSVFEKGKKKNKGLGQTPAGPARSGTPGAAMSSPGTTPEPGKKGKGKNKRAEQSQSPGSSMTPGAPITSLGTTPEVGKKGKGKNKNKRAEQFQPGPATSPDQSAGAPAGTAPEVGKRGQGKGKQKLGATPGAPTDASAPPSAQNAPVDDGRGKHKPGGVNNPPPSNSNQGPTSGSPAGEKRHEGKGKNAASATPGPQ